MNLFTKIPDRLFNVLASKNKELYVQAMFIVRDAFTTELTMKRTDLVSMLIGSLEDSLIEADFSEELGPEDSPENSENLSGKAHFIIRKLLETGWIATEYERNSFEENITVPDYSIRIINLLYDLCEEQQKEYNGYVFSTYSTLFNASKEHPEYLHNALNTAYRNTRELIEELKILYNNIQKYYQRISDELTVNELLTAHFDEYKTQIIDSIYYPLKTIDSVPRFKNTIINILNEMLMDEAKHEVIIKQGIASRMYADEHEGSDDVLRKISYIIDTYEGLEELISSIDHKHNLYINATVDKIRYKLNSDQSIKGKLVEILKSSNEENILEPMKDSILAYRQSYMDDKSLFQRIKRDGRKEGKPLPIRNRTKNTAMIEGFIDTVKQSYSEKKVADFILSYFRPGVIEISSRDIPIHTEEDFILLLLGTIQGYRKNGKYQVLFEEEYIENNGYQVPLVRYRRKER